MTDQAEVLDLDHERRRRANTHFGVCPYCHGHDGYLNVRQNHVFVCDRHKVGWVAGMNLFSSWQEETEDDWERNSAKLEAEYTCVEPAFPDEPKFEPDPDADIPY